MSYAPPTRRQLVTDRIAEVDRQRRRTDASVDALGFTSRKAAQVYDQLRDERRQLVSARRRITAERIGEWFGNFVAAVSAIVLIGVAFLPVGGFFELVTGP